MAGWTASSPNHDEIGHYLMTEGQDETLAAYGKEIIPQFSGVAA